uniref:Uncharacterized protein n=1 Tax=viral metagenome TaxID=1070528 RepID=A0A6C0EPX6_9ZZZZ
MALQSGYWCFRCCCNCDDEEERQPILRIGPRRLPPGQKLNYAKVRDKAETDCRNLHNNKGTYWKKVPNEQKRRWILNQAEFTEEFPIREHIAKTWFP